MSEESEPVVDPPEVSGDDARDSESPTATEWVTITQTATVTLPSGASYVLGAGTSLELESGDATFIIDEGYGIKADEPGGE